MPVIRPLDPPSFEFDCVSHSTPDPDSTKRPPLDKKETQTLFSLSLSLLPDYDYEEEDDHQNGNAALMHFDPLSFLSPHILTCSSTDARERVFIP
jgi:hypothetical protein